MSTKKDLYTAQRIMEDPNYNRKDKMFHKDSPIYVKSNEKIQNYQKYLEKRKKVLSVIASSDQLLDMIVSGTKEIDAYDISRFPKYYMGLKFAGVQSLDRDKYINFFYEGDKRAYLYDRMYEKMRDTLNDRDKEFWDGLFNFYDWNEISNSSLFSNETISVSDVINQNKYLDKNHYDELKDLITDVDVDIYEGDILEISKVFKEKYDLIYMSNIIKYLYENNYDLRDYKNMLKKLRMTRSGISLTYLNGINEVIRDEFKDIDYRIEEFEDSKSGVLVYKRRKKK